MTQPDRRTAMAIVDSKHLPAATFGAMFGAYRFLYKGKLLSVKLVNFEGDVARAIEVGDFMYVEQNKFGNSRMAGLARAGNFILNIVDKRTMKTIGRVINGKVFRLQNGD